MSYKRPPDCEYFINERQVSRRQATQHWWSSSTYRNANARTRNGIFCDAEEGINDNGELNHLREAGITINRVKP